MPKKNHRTRYADPSGYRFKGKVPLRAQLGLDERGVASLIDRDGIKNLIPESEATLYKRCALGKETRIDVAKSLNVSDIGLKVLLKETEQKILMQAIFLGIVKSNPLKPATADSAFELGQSDTLAREEETVAYAKEAAAEATAHVDNPDDSSSA